MGIEGSEEKNNCLPKDKVLRRSVEPAAKLGPTAQCNMVIRRLQRWGRYVVVKRFRTLC